MSGASGSELDELIMEARMAVIEHSWQGFLMSWSITSGIMVSPEMLNGPYDMDKVLDDGWSVGSIGMSE